MTLTKAERLEVAAMIQDATKLLNSAAQKARTEDLPLLPVLRDIAAAQEQGNAAARRLINALGD